MAITVDPRPMWSQQTNDKWSEDPCGVSWGPSGPLNSHGSDIPHGERFLRGPTVTGNHVDALPYWCSKLQFNNTNWNFWVEDPWGPKPCPRFRYSGNAGGITAVTQSDLVYTSANSPSREDELFCDRMAILKAKAALRKADASIPMLFRERIATLNMLKSYSGRSLDLIRRRQLADVKRYKRLSRRSSKEGRKFLAQSIANEHLMFVFGMLPLISDMEGLADHLTRDEHFHITGRGRMTRVRETKATEPWPYWISSRTTKNTRYSARCSLRADISVEMLNDMQRLGFNPLYTAYDFTPLSFITGWFSNFNYWLQSLDPLIGAEYRTGSLTVRREITTTKEAHCLPTNGVSKGSGNGKSSGTFWSQERIPIPSDPPTGGLELYNNLSFFSVTAGISLYLQRKIKLANTAIAQRPFRYRSSRPVTLPPITYKR